MANNIDLFTVAPAFLKLCETTLNASEWHALARWRAVLSEDKNSKQRFFDFLKEAVPSSFDHKIASQLEIEDKCEFVHSIDQLFFAFRSQHELIDLLESQRFY